MAEGNYESGNANVESGDRGLFDFMKKNKEEDVIATEFEQKVEVPKEEEKKEEGGLLHKFHRSDSSSSSSSDEEGDDEEKKRRRKERKEKKKGLKEKIKEKLHGSDHEDTHVPVEKIHVEENVYSEPSHPIPTPPPADVAGPDEKKGLLEKIKDKLPGQHKKADVVEDHHEHVAVPATTTAAATVDVEGQEKKGFLEKIKEKIPGFHPKPSEEGKRECEEVPPTSST